MTNGSESVRSSMGLRRSSCTYMAEVGVLLCSHQKTHSLMFERDTTITNCGESDIFYVNYCVVTYFNALLFS